MSNNIKISIILPIYNVEKYLKRCIDSVISQTLKDIEIILATDGPEGCDKICEEYAEKDFRIKIISHPGSYGKAINHGIDIAQGEYIGIVETDDWVAPDMYEKLYKKALETGSEMVKCGWYNSYDYNPKQREILFAPEMDDFVISQNLYVLNSQPSVWSAIYKKEFLDKHNIRFIEDKISYIDSPFHIMTLLTANKIGIIHKPLYYYYQDNLMQSVKSKEKVFDGIRAEQFLYERLKEKPELYEKYKEGLIYTTVAHLMWNYERIKDSHKQDFWKESQKFIKTLDLTNVTNKMLYAGEEKFLKSLLEFENWKDYEKSQKLFYELKFLGISILKLESIYGENGMNLYKTANFYLKLFYIIPILRVKKIMNRKIYYLFNFIPLLKIKRTTEGSDALYLFGVIPFSKINNI